MRIWSLFHRLMLQIVLEYGFEKLFINPYGVDLSMFMPTNSLKRFDTNGYLCRFWSYQKGCDLLIEAFNKLKGQIRLLHVGSIADVELPRQDWFSAQDPVPQNQLIEWYARADVFVLASRQDDLMVCPKLWLWFASRLYRSYWRSRSH